MNDPHCIFKLQFMNIFAYQSQEKIEVSLAKKISKKRKKVISNFFLT